MNGRIAVASEPRLDASRGDCRAYAHFQSVIQSADQCLWPGPTASVDRDDLIATRKERETLRLIKAVTRQVERGIAAGGAQPFEEVEIEFRACNGACISEVPSSMAPP